MGRNNALENVRILTTDPDKRIGLYAIRYLGRAGGKISCVAKDTRPKLPLGFYSKYLREKIYLSDVNYQNELKHFLSRRTGDFDLINPIEISNMLCVLDAQSEYNLNCTFLLPERESLVIADDKELLTRHASKIGLACPKTYYRVSPDEIDNLCLELTFPCIVKFRGDNRATHWNPEDRYAVANTPRELSAEYKRMHAVENYPIIQEYIHGPGFGFFALYDKNRELKAHFSHKRVREYPVSGGPSSCCESVYDPELYRIGRKLLESLDWTGLAMVEFKYDIARNQFFIIEVNPRYWGSLPLAVNSGVNFPVLHAMSALDIEYPAVDEYRRGVKTRFFHSDVKAILAGIHLEKGWCDKMRLFLKIFDPTIKEGFIVGDDIKPVIGSLLQKKI